MIKIDQNYTDYRDDTDPKYPGGKAVDATTSEGTDGTPLLADWMNDINGALQAIFIEAFGNINKVSGKPDNVRESDVLKAIKKITQDYTDKKNADEARARVQGDIDAFKSAQGYTDQSVRDEVQARAQGDTAIQKKLDAHIKGDNPHGITKVKIGLGNVDNTSDAQKSVKYAASAGSAKANGGNADTVGGFKAGNGTGMLVPVTAFNVSRGTGYIKFGNGLLLQWGTTRNQQQVETVYFPIAFQSNDYAIACVAAKYKGIRWSGCSVHNKSSSAITITTWVDGTFDNKPAEVFFISIGRG